MNRNVYFLVLLLTPFILFSQPVREEFSGIPQKETELTFYVKLNVFLEGPFKEDQMLTDLNKSKLIPLNQPFNTSPWYYEGNESVTSIPNGNVVDWVLVELRNATNPDSATSGTIFGKQAGFLLNSGKVVGLDGVSNLVFDTTYT